MVVMHLITLPNVADFQCQTNHC